MIPEPFPQIGAVLCLDTELPGDYKDGSKYWKLAGSCVLVAPRLILTIGHILGERHQPPRLERYLVFLPYQGLLELDGEPPEWEENQVEGDNLVLLLLKDTDTVEEWAPLPPRNYDLVQQKEQGDALVCGYGSWPQSGLSRMEGIQQHHLVRLAHKDGEVPWRHYDRLDLSWSSSRNNGLIPGRGNSGGPMLTESPAGPLVGIIREAGMDQQAGSWIGRDRWRWLADLVQPQPPHPEHRYELLRIDGTGQTIRFQVPNGAKGVRATLNASQGMRLQMKIAHRPEELQQLEESDPSSGRFLCRKLDLEAGTKEIVIGVCPVKRAPKHATEVLAQLCVLFL